MFRLTAHTGMTLLQGAKSLKNPGLALVPWAHDPGIWDGAARLLGLEIVRDVWGARSWSKDPEPPSLLIGPGTAAPVSV